MTIQEKLLQIQGNLKAPKNQRNNFGKYNYRSCEDILEAVKPLLLNVEASLMITDTVSEVAGMPLVEARAVFFDNEGKVEVTAQAGIDPNRKGMDIAQSFGSSSSYARKYALNGLFLIDDTKDSDATNTHDDKPTVWLNENTSEFDRAKAKLQSGELTIATLKTKVLMSKKVEQLLLTN
tara:strand:+ start:6556 stop:7092 length:537 start_codon:yes stop_codon:yes gene_type:complete